MTEAPPPTQQEPTGKYSFGTKIEMGRAVADDLLMRGELEAGTNVLILAEYAEATAERARRAESLADERLEYICRLESFFPDGVPSGYGS